MLFKQDADKIFEIIGPEAAKFAKQKGEIEEAIVAQELKMQKAINELADLKGQVERYNNLLHVAQARLRGTDEALKLFQARLKLMQQANVEVENVLKAIPTTVEHTEKHPVWFIFSTTRTVRRIQYIRILLT